MSEQPSWFSELDELLNKLCMEALSADERQRLNEMLRAGEAQRQHYRRYLNFHAAMKWESSQSNDVVPTFGRLFQEARSTDLQAAVESIADIDRSPTEASSEPNKVPAFAPIFSDFGGMAYNAVSSISHGWPLAYLIAVVTCGIGVMIGSMVQVSSPDQMATTSVAPFKLKMDPKVEFVGRITGLIDCQWANSETAVVGHVAVPLGRKYSLASGLMEITYNTGAKVILQGPVTYEVDSAAGGFLSVGKLTAKVEKKAEGGGRKADNVEPLASPLHLPPSALFSVRTPTATVTDLGTEFGVEVDKQGQTVSHVFRGLVRVQTVAIDGKPQGDGQLLRENESATVGKPIADQTAVVNPSAKPVEFVREMPRMRTKTFDLVDVVAGGNGFSGRRNAGIDPTTGRATATPPPAPTTVEEYLVGDGKYHRVDGLPFVDGVFIVDGSRGPVQTDSTGRVYAGFPETQNCASYCIWAGGAFPADIPFRTELGGVDYASSGHGVLFLEPNKGITFDLDAIRRANPGSRLVRFRTTAGNTETASEGGLPVSADLWILVDGQARFKRREINGYSGAMPVSVPIGDTDRFLTLATTDGGNGISWDWTMFGDPRLEFSTTTRQDRQVSHEEAKGGGPTSSK